MRLRRQIVAASAVAALVACSAISAFAAPLASLANTPAGGPWSLAPGEYYTELSGSSFQTGSSFDNGGVRQYFVGKQQQIGLQSYTELGWKKNWSFQMSLPLVTTTVRGATAGGSSSTGLGDIGLGLRYRFTNGSSASSLQLRWEAPMGYNPRLEPSLGDGRQKLSATLQFGCPGVVRSSFLQLAAGYRYEYMKLARTSYLPWEFSIGNPLPPINYTAPPTDYDWSDYFTLGGAAAVWSGPLQVSYLAAMDLPRDTGRGALNAAGTASYKTKTMEFAHGPRLTYHTDERLDTFAGCWLTSAGKNTLCFTEYYAGIAWRSTKLSRLQGFLGGASRP